MYKGIGSRDFHKSNGSQIYEEPCQPISGADPTFFTAEFKTQIQCV
jgi:hypothetical protein